MAGQPTILEPVGNPSPALANGANPAKCLFLRTLEIVAL